MAPIARLLCLAAALIGLLALQPADALQLAASSEFTQAARTVLDEWSSAIINIENAEGAAPFVAIAKLSGDNQVPEPIETNSTGLFGIAIGNNTATWLLAVLDVHEFTMSHIHYGDSTSNGPPGVLLAPGVATADGALPMFEPALSGRINSISEFTSADIMPIPGVDSPTLGDLKAAIMSDMVYVNVHTVAAPAGLIRAQLEETTLDDALEHASIALQKSFT